MYKIKQRPEDFIVNEIFSPKLKKQGDYVYFRLKKTNYNTIDAIKKIANAIKLPFKRFGFAGAKDKNAVTSQVVSVKTNDEAKITMLRELKLKDIEIEILGKSDQPVSLGDHEGNEFIVTIRNLKEIPKKINTKLMEEKKPFMLIGPGRWGSTDPWLGIPVIWSDIAGARVIVETPYKERHIDPSQGSHFFHDMIASQVLYLITKKDEDIDWDWFKKQKIVQQTDFVKHIETPKPLKTIVDGKIGKGLTLNQNKIVTSQKNR